MKKSYNDDTCNLIKHIEIQKQLQLHEKRIQNSKATLNFRSTGKLHKNCQSASHIKKQPLAQFNRIVSINIENKALLDKLTNQPRSKIGSEKPYKLIKNNRKKNFDEYNQRRENEGLSKRIREAKSSYKLEKFVTQRKITEKYVNSICKFGYKDYKPNKTLICRNRNIENSRKLQTSDSPQEKQNYPRNKCTVSGDEGLYTALPVIIQLIDEQQLQIKAEGFKAILEGVRWSHKVSLQINCSNGNSFVLEIPIHKFIDSFDENVDKLIRSIRFNERQQFFYLEE